MCPAGGRQASPADPWAAPHPMGAQRDQLGSELRAPQGGFQAWGTGNAWPQSMWPPAPGHCCRQLRCWHSPAWLPPPSLPTDHGTHPARGPSLPFPAEGAQHSRACSRLPGAWMSERGGSRPRGSCWAISPGVCPGQGTDTDPIPDTGQDALCPQPPMLLPNAETLSPSHSSPPRPWLQADTGAFVHSEALTSALPGAG